MRHRPTRVASSPRWLWLLLAVVVVATSTLAVRSHDGHDFVNNVWAPLRGLLAGHNPYDPGDSEYLARYEVPVVGALYVPSVYVLHAPLALLGRARSGDVIAAVDALLIWAGVLLLIRPRNVRCCVATACAGALILASAPAQDTIILGQMSAWSFAGLALLVSTAERDRTGGWLPAAGVALVALKPQSGIPIFLALILLRYWRVLVRAAVIVGVTSVPGLVLFARNAGGVAGMWHTGAANLRVLQALPPNDLAIRANNRVDALGALSRFGVPVGNGVVWAVVGLGVSTALLLVVVRARRSYGAQGLRDPLVVTAVSVYVAVALIHLSYDQLLLLVGPLLAVALWLDGEADIPAKVVAVGGGAVLAVECAFRAGFRSRLIDAGLDPLRVREAWLTVPTVLAVTSVVAGLIAARWQRLETVSSDVGREEPLQY
jgi:hypothetical protein